MKFSLIHPSRSRPTKSFSATQAWLNSCSTTEVELIVSIDENDPHRDQYKLIYNPIQKAKVIVNNNRSAVDAINNAAKVSTGEILIVVSDDTDCIRNWDDIILKATAGCKDFILKTYDGVQKWLCTMPIMDRTYYNRFGYIYYPEYFHQFCDCELTHVADITKKMIWRNDIEIKHLHYSVLKQQRDSLYQRNDNSWNEGKNLYMRRLKESFGLNDVDVMDIRGESHVQWLKNVLK